MCRLTDTGEGTGPSPFTEVHENERAFVSGGNGCRNRIGLTATIGTEVCLKREWWHSDLGGRAEDRELLLKGRVGQKSGNAEPRGSCQPLRLPSKAANATH